MKQGRLPQLQCRGHKAHYPKFLHSVLTPGHSVRVSQLKAASQNHISRQSSSLGEKNSASATWLLTYRHGKVKKLHMNSVFLQVPMHLPCLFNSQEGIPTGCDQTRRRQIFIGYSYELCQWQAVLLLEEQKWKIITYLNHCQGFTMLWAQHFI